jgi:glycosyl-4,4'-diaponeurosporenoate acyltransferase
VIVVLPWPVALGVSIAVWIGSSLAIGLWAARQPVTRFPCTGRVLRLRPWEAGGRWYERRLRIKRWKDVLPEAGSWFGGRSKQHLPTVADGGIAGFVPELGRAETVHWASLATGVLHLLWCPLWLGLCMVGFGLGNLAFVAVQRYNRARIARALARRAPHG